MCNPIIVNDISHNPNVMVRHLLTEIHKAQTSLLMPPKFVDIPTGPFLTDAEVNADHASDHLSAASELAFKLMIVLEALESKEFSHKLDVIFKQIRKGVEKHDGK